MKTKTYARLSLLIPFLIWGLLLAYSLFLSSLAAGNLLADVTNSIGDWITRAIAFYVIGILFWFLPYVLLGLILFTLTFYLEARVLVHVFALSPILMTLFTLALTAAITLWGPWQGTLTQNFSPSFQDFTSFNILLIIFVLIWSYICVGIGFGLYKLLQHFEIVRDGAKPDADPILIEGWILDPSSQASRES